MLISAELDRAQGHRAIAEAGHRPRHRPGTDHSAVALERLGESGGGWSGAGREIVTGG